MDSLITISSMTNSEQLSKDSNANLVIRYDTVVYRGQEIIFLSDPSGVQCFAKWGTELFDLGLNNPYYKDEICKVIDRRLDLITEFRNCPDFVGAKLEYFKNGDYRDIKLSYKGRLIKCFLVVGPVNETWIISESEKILINSGLLEKD